MATQTELFETVPEQLPTDNKEPEMAATVEKGAVRRMKMRRQKRNSPTDDGHALLNSVIIEFVTRERDELESSAQTKVFWKASRHARVWCRPSVGAW